jgi:hypothetical protein
MKWTAHSTQSTQIGIFQSDGLPRFLNNNKSRRLLQNSTKISKNYCFISNTVELERIIEQVILLFHPFFTVIVTVNELQWSFYLPPTFLQCYPPPSSSHQLINTRSQIMIIYGFTYDDHSLRLGLCFVQGGAISTI